MAAATLQIQEVAVIGQSDYISQKPETFIFVVKIFRLI